MVLVDFPVDSGGDVLVMCLIHSLVCDSGGDLLVDGGIMLSRLGHEIADGGLGFIHFDI